MAWDHMKFAQRLREAREAYRPHGGTRVWSREKAAVALGFTRNTLDNYERGVTSPTIESVARMADYYGVTMGWLCCLTDEGGPSVEPDQVFGGDPSSLGVNEVKALAGYGG
jgi:transcriptional regulator with XRE-family HTH domain